MTTTYRPAEPGRATAPRATTTPRTATGPPGSYGADDHADTGTGTDTDTGTGPGPRLWAPRGRHRRPRPRKALLAAGGMALAAGVLGLVRMTPESGVAGPGTAEAEPRPDSPPDATGSDRATRAAATTGAVPEVSPSATAALGGVSSTPFRRVSLAHTPSATTAPPTPAPDTTTIPDAPNPPGAPAPTDTTAARPTPTRPPTPTPPASRTSAAPTTAPQQPGQAHRPGLCVPIIGVCVDQLNH